VTGEKAASSPWMGLVDILPPELVRMPRTATDPGSDRRWPSVPDEVVAYLAKHAIGRPWGQHLVFAATILSARHLAYASVIGYIENTAATLRELFPALGLNAMDLWVPDVHLVAYLTGAVLPEHSSSRRVQFWRYYRTMATHCRRWLESLPGDVQAPYRRWLLPLPDPWLLASLSNETALVRAAQAARKTAVAAVVPYLMQIRSQAHFRFNQMERLRRIYREACTEAERQGRAGLPHEIVYDEGGDPARGMPARQRLRFRLWDRRSFVLAHAWAYPDEYLRRVTDRFGPTWNRFLLEYVGAERLDGMPADAPGLWFLELLERDVVGAWPIRGTAAERAAKQAWLRSWGHGEGSSLRTHSPFATGIAGLISWDRTGDGRFTRRPPADGSRWIPVDGLYAGALFGVLAIDIFTTTGMRMNEALQIRIEPDCFLELATPAPTGAQDHTPRTAWVFRLIPKGERDQRPQNYRVDDQVRHQVAKTVWHLAIEHYGLAAGELLPMVAYARGVREHRFPPGRYLFQHRRRALSNIDLNACIRFLVHGLSFVTAEGNPVALTSHLLRHVVATYLLQVEEVPIDIVAEILKHKNPAVTAY
jgi:integrase